MELTYDLHIHSALSPCASNDMTPATIAGFCKLAGVDVVSISDHNSARNLPSARRACAYYGLTLLPAIEVNTEEEIHLLCYFPSVESALEMGRLLYKKLPNIKADPKIWGDQYVLDEEDNIIDVIDKLLINAVALNMYRVKDACEELGGIVVPAHMDKSSFSFFSVLGMLPEDISFAAAELIAPDLYGQYCRNKKAPNGMEILFSSDAHNLTDLQTHRCKQLSEKSVLYRLLCR